MLITNKALLPRVPVDKLPNLKKIVVVDEDVEDNYIDFISLMETASDEFDIEWLSRDDGLILHYTSGSTGNLRCIACSTSNVSARYFWKICIRLTRR